MPKPKQRTLAERPDAGGASAPSPASVTGFAFRGSTRIPRHLDVDVAERAGWTPLDLAATRSSTAARASCRFAPSTSRRAVSRSCDAIVRAPRAARRDDHRERSRRSRADVARGRRARGSGRPAPAARARARRCRRRSSASRRTTSSRSRRRCASRSTISRSARCSGRATKDTGYDGGRPRRWCAPRRRLAGAADRGHRRHHARERAGRDRRRRRRRWR